MVSDRPMMEEIRAEGSLFCKGNWSLCQSQKQKKAEVSFADRSKRERENTSLSFQEAPPL